MRKILVQLKPNRDQYTVDYISCYEKPLGIAVEALQPGYGRMFYVWLKLMRAYHNVSDNSDCVFRYAREILPRFGLNLNTFNLPGDLLAWIKDEIDQRHPVLVPGNLRELFYSYHYKTTDWEHLFLISGYDDEKEIFFVLDGCQKSSEEFRYEPFVIPFNIIAEMYESYKMVFLLTKVYAIETITREADNPAIILLDSLNFLTDQLHEQPYREVPLMERPLSGPVTANIISLPLFKIVKHKDLLYSELIDQMQEHLKLEEDDLSDLSKLKNNLIEEWNLVINSYIISAVRKKTFPAAEKAAGAMNADQCMRKKLRDAGERWLALNPNGTDKQSATAKAFLLENNEDQLIVFDGSKISMDFRGDKLYNCWISDNSPKAMCRQTDFLREDFHFSVQMNVTAASDETLYHSGIIFRTTFGELYYWGIINGSAVMLSKIGDFQDVSNTQYKENQVILQIRKSLNQYMFGFSHIDGREMNNVLSTSDIGEIAQIGIGCKTWDKADPLRIEFSNLHINPSLLIHEEIL
jgi:hypothetical protein